MRRWLIVPAMLLPFLLWYDCNFRIRVRTVEISLPHIPHEIRIANISDLNGLNYGTDNRIFSEIVKRHAPDWICLTGTLYETGDESGRRIAERLSAALFPIAPVFCESVPTPCCALGPPEIQLITLKPLQ